MPTFSVSHTPRRVRALVDRSAALRTVKVREDWLGSGPVVLVGGFCTTDLALEPLRDWLVRLGYTVTIHTVGSGVGCGRRSVARLQEVVRTAAAQDAEHVRGAGSGSPTR